MNRFGKKKTRWRISSIRQDPVVRLSVNVQTVGRTPYEQCASQRKLWTHQLDKIWKGSIAHSLLLLPRRGVFLPFYRRWFFTWGGVELCGSWASRCLPQERRRSNLTSGASWCLPFFGGVEMSTTPRASSGITSERRRYVFIMGVVMSSFWASSCLPSPKASIYLAPGHRPTVRDASTSVSLHVLRRLLRASLAALVFLSK